MEGILESQGCHSLQLVCTEIFLDVYKLGVLSVSSCTACMCKLSVYYKQRLQSVFLFYLKFSSFKLLLFSHS